MKERALREIRTGAAPPSKPGERVPLIKKTPTSNRLTRLDHGVVALPPATPQSPQEPSAPSVEEDGSNAAIGCKTSRVALALLAQLVRFDFPNGGTRDASDRQMEAALENATAILTELQPTTAAAAMLAAQMIGTQRTAMRFLVQATMEGQTGVGADANVLRATRLMRLFNEQVDTMAKLKGKGGQQRVVVEHVSVAAGGQAIVGTAIAGGAGGPSGDNRR